MPGRQGRERPWLALWLQLVAGNGPAPWFPRSRNQTARSGPCRPSVSGGRMAALHGPVGPSAGQPVCRQNCPAHGGLEVLCSCNQAGAWRPCRPCGVQLVVQGRQATRERPCMALWGLCSPGLQGTGLVAAGSVLPALWGLCGAVCRPTGLPGAWRPRSPVQLQPAGQPIAFWPCTCTDCGCGRRMVSPAGPNTRAPIGRRRAVQGRACTDRIQATPGGRAGPPDTQKPACSGSVLNPGKGSVSCEPTLSRSQSQCELPYPRETRYAYCSGFGQAAITTARNR